MKSIVAFFTTNFGLKLLALILAIIVFYAVRDSGGAHRVEPPIFNRGK